MKYATMILLGVLMMASQVIAQEYRGVSFEMTVDNNNGRTQVLTLGLVEGASSGLDPTFEEAELPPLPPNEIFDARCVSTPGVSDLGLGSLVDYRDYPTSMPDVTEKYTLAYQAGINATGVSVSWSELPGRITRLLVDGEDKTGESGFETQFASGQIAIEISFDLSPLAFTANPNPVMLTHTSRQQLPSQDLRITPMGDTRAQWSLTTDVEWLTIEPMEGEGDQTVSVALNSQTLPQGEYDGTIFVRSLVNNARLDVPVHLTMLVGVENDPQPDGFHLAQNYPNPFGPGAISASNSTAVALDIGRLRGSASPTLRVYDALGREVMDLSSRLSSQPGTQYLTIEAGNLPAGVYTCVLRHGGSVQVRSMMLLK
jgi:hypothetical protein